MNRDRYPMYGVVLVAGAAVAVWASMPGVFLLFLLFLAYPPNDALHDEGDGWNAWQREGWQPDHFVTGSPGNEPL